MARMELTLSDRLERAVDDWRRQQPDLPTRPESIRRIASLFLELDVAKPLRKKSADETAVAPWVSAMCITDPQATAKPMELYEEYADYERAHDRAPISVKAFSHALQAAGFPRAKSMGARLYLGIRLRQVNELAD